MTIQAWIVYVTMLCMLCLTLPCVMMPCVRMSSVTMPCIKKCCVSMLCAAMSWTGAILYKGGCHFSSFVREGSGSSFVEVDDFICTDGFGSRRVWPQLRSNDVKNMHVLVYKLAGPAEGGAAVPPVRVSSPAAASAWQHSCCWQLRHG